MGTTKKSADIKMQVNCVSDVYNVYCVSDVYNVYCVSVVYIVCCAYNVSDVYGLRKRKTAHSEICKVLFPSNTSVAATAAVRSSNCNNVRNRLSLFLAFYYYSTTAVKLHLNRFFVKVVIACNQCDQMVTLVFQYLAICNNENLPKNVTNLPK